MSNSRAVRRKLKKRNSKSNSKIVARDAEEHNIQNQTAIIQEHFSGPLPHPDILEKYEQIVPKAAERILAMAERQADHRQKLERLESKSDVVLSFTGQICALVFVLSTIGGATYCIAKGQPVGGGVLGGIWYR